MIHSYPPHFVFCSHLEVSHGTDHQLPSPLRPVKTRLTPKHTGWGGGGEGAALYLCSRQYERFGLIHKEITQEESNALGAGEKVGGRGDAYDVCWDKKPPLLRQPVRYSQHFHYRQGVCYSYGSCTMTAALDKLNSIASFFFCLETTSSAQKSKKSGKTTFPKPPRMIIQACVKGLFGGKKDSALPK